MALCFIYEGHGVLTMIWCLAVSAAIFAADYAIKNYISHSMTLGSFRNSFLPFLKISYIQNHGAALGIMQGKKIFLIIISAVIISALVYALASKKIKSCYIAVSLSMIVGGGVCNLLDRIMYGYVIDYISLSFFPPVCNLSDYCISAGIAMLAINLIFSKKHRF